MKKGNANECLHERYLKAVKDVQENGISCRKSAEKWGLTRTALQDRLNGKVEYHRRKGPAPVLTKSEEDQFTDWLINLSKRGFGLSKNQFLHAVKTFLDKDGRTNPFKNNRPGNKWYRSFVKRNPILKIRKARPLEKKRAVITRTDVDLWFADFETFLLDKSLTNRPSQIWNCDETGFDLQGRAGKVIGPSDRKQAPYRVLNGSREHITMLPCFNACGQWMSPYFIFPGKRVPVTYNPLEGGVEGSVFSMTDSGYMDTETFYMWFANHFIPNLPPARPVLLLIDGHDSHLDLHTFQLAEKNQVHIYSLLKNATHLVQPADVGLFGHMKKSWYSSVREYSQQNPNADINKKNFCSVFKPTWEEVMRPSILIAAFRKSGIYPLDKEKVSEGLLDVTSDTCNHTVYPGHRKSVSNHSAAAEAFDALDAAISTPARSRYRRRVEENYDLEGSPAFCAWKKLYTSSHPKSNVCAQPRSARVDGKIDEPKQSILTSESRASSLQLNSSTTVLREILTYPSLQPKVPAKKKNIKRALPNFVSGPESMQLLLNEKLKKARQVAEKQKRLREKEKKKEEKRKKEEDEKQRKERRPMGRKGIKENVEDRNGKRSKKSPQIPSEGTFSLQEADKKQRKERRPRGRKRLKENVEDRNGKRSKKSPQIPSEGTFSMQNENICSSCFQEYRSSDDENNPWILCDSCNSWMHMRCVPFEINIECTHTDDPFFCHGCQM